MQFKTRQRFFGGFFNQFFPPVQRPVVTLYDLTGTVYTTVTRTLTKTCIPSSAFVADANNDGLPITPPCTSAGSKGRLIEAESELKERISPSHVDQ